MMTVHEVSKTTGVSIRTLHYYDEIGLLHPSEITDANYRLYDDTALEQLQQILFFKELDFPLKDIAIIMSDPSFDRYEALLNHKDLLVKRLNRLGRLIGLVDRILKGENNMSFNEFDVSDIEKAKKAYADEAKSRWGHTEAYRQSERKTAGYNRDQWETITKECNDIFRAFSEKRMEGPASAPVQQLVKDWQSHISRNYYDCTKEILAGLGDMYVSDQRFKTNIDRFGEGTAEFISAAIRYYCSNL